MFRLLNERGECTVRLKLPALALMKAAYRLGQVRIPPPAIHTIFEVYFVAHAPVGEEEAHDAEGVADGEEYNPYLEQEQEQRSLVSSEYSREEQALTGLRLDNVEFDEQNLFDNFKPIFNYSVPNTAPFAEDSADDLSLEGGKGKAKYGKSVKLKLALEQSVDLLF